MKTLKSARFLTRIRNSASVLFSTVILLLTILQSSAVAAHCPFCDAPTLMMAEQIQQCDHLLLGRWVSGVKPTATEAGSSVYEVKGVGRSSGDAFAVGQQIQMPFYIAGTEEKLYAIMGPGTQLLEWHAPLEVTDAGWKYLSELPPPVTEPAAQTERLIYAMNHLEHPDQMVANDAYAEFAAAPYEVIVPLRDRLPREKLLNWLMDPNTAVTRIGLYGLLIGLCGTDAEASAIEQKIVVLDKDFRNGIDGVMSGYLLIRGEAGLQVIDDSKLRATTCRNAAGEEVKLPFSETYAAMQALRFMWTYEPDRIPKDRLKVSMRLLLERPELTDLVIADLTRWKDWDIQDRLMQMYDEEKFNVPAIKRAVVRYLHYCSLDKAPAATEGAPGEPTEAAVRAAANLKLLEEKDPRTVNDAKRYLIR
ncbi:MAG: hypothetical protein JNL58_24390 [Planctomyces sp.]|nr:hypothetical protein [Planctomyces sp.]